MNKTLVTILVIAVLGLGGWFLWGKKDTVSTEKAIKIGISQITSHAVFDDIISGIKERFAAAGYVEGKSIVFDIQNAQGDNATNAAIAQKFANGDHDLFMPLGTPASQALVNLVKDKPIVFGAVTDPETAGLVASSSKPGANVTGTSDITLYKEHLELLRKLAPNATKIGIVYNPGEANARFGLEQTRREAESLDFTIVTAAANTSGDILSAAKSIVSKVDAFYILPDNTILSGQDALIKVAIEGKKPLIAIDQSGVEKGALATLGTNYKKVGERTVEVALKVLNGENPGNIAVLGVTDADLFINTTTAQKIGIKLPEGFASTSKQIYK